MEPDVTMDSAAMIRVAVVSVGGPIPSPSLRNYVSMLTRQTRVDQSAVASFYTELQKSPFAHQPWDTGSLRFKYVVGGAPASPWEDFQPHRKTLAVVGLCHCPASPDLSAAEDEFREICKGYPTALATRCYGFAPSDAQLEEGRQKGSSIIMFPPADQQAQELHMVTMVQDLAATLLMEFEKWVFQAESTGTLLKTPLDSQATLGAEEVIKAKKRRLGRAQKTIGDYCLLAGSPVDANAHYSTAIELARLTNDVFWHAGALEGSVCALLMDRMGQTDADLEDEVRFRYSNVIQLYRRSFLQDNAQRVSTVSFELEAALKLARFLLRVWASFGRHQNAKEVVDLLMSAADGAKSLIDANDRLILYVEIARLFGSLGYQRKAAFFSRQVSQLYLQQDNTCAAISAMKVLSLTSKAYHVQSRGENANRSTLTLEGGSGQIDGGKVHPQSIISLFESRWSTLQMVVLREILMSSVRAGDPLAAWSAAARLLRSFYPLITPAGQNGLASSLGNSAERLPSGTRCADPALPFVRLHSFPVHSSQVGIIKRNPEKKEWWTGAAPSGPFIYTPFSKGGSTDNSKQELTWIVGEPIQVLVELANPCAFDLLVESTYLSIHSGNVDVFPVSVNLPPNTSKVVLLSGIPTKVGPVSVPGCIVHCFGVITEHLFKEVENLLLGASQGLVLSDPFRCCGSGKYKNISIPTISVVQPLPLLLPNVVGGDCSAILYEGEIRDIWINLTNAGTLPVEQAHLSLTGKHQDSVISIAHETLESALPLKPGAQVTFPVTMKAFQLSVLDSDNDASRNTSGNSRRISKDGSSPLLVIHYAGPLTDPSESSTAEFSVPPGRRLVLPLHVSVMQGLRFVNARLLSMEIPAHIGKGLPNIASSAEISTHEKTALDRADRLVKFNPYQRSSGLHLLELELANPTDVVFEVNVFFELNGPVTKAEHETAESGCATTRIDRDHSARVVIPLEHFKLPFLDGSIFSKDKQTNGPIGREVSGAAEGNTKAELNASVNNLISKIKVRWQSGRNSSGELNIKDAIHAVLHTWVMDILLPEPLTYEFKLLKNVNDMNADSLAGSSMGVSDSPTNSGNENTIRSSGSILAHEMTNMEVCIHNNSKESIQLSLNITCRDVAGHNCTEGTDATVLWAGILNGISLEVPPLQEVVHSFSLYFLVPGEYTLLAAAAIDDATDVLRARAKTDSSEGPIFCRGSPFHIHVSGTA